MHHQPKLDGVLHFVRQIAAEEGPAEASDQHLLRRFADQNDDRAFAQLVRRHGAMVLGVCRRVLRDPHAADDAFQATFLALASRPTAIRQQASLSSWLHRVAYRAAQRARYAAARRRAHDRQAPVRVSPDPQSELSWREMCEVLDAELQRLPNMFRAPLVLCYLEGLTRDQAAQQLGWSVSTLKGRLERGREMLRCRLIRRGITLSAGLMATLLTQTSASAPPGGVIAEMACLAVSIRAGQRAAVAGSVAQLARGILAEPWLARLKIAALVVFFGFITAGTGAWMFLRAPVSKEPARADEPSARTPPLQLPRAAASEAARLDRHGDPLPLHALARFGTVRFRHEWTLSATAISPDGRLLAGSGGSSVQIWDAQSGRTLQRLPLTGFRCRVLALAFTADSKELGIYEEVETGFKGQPEALGRVRIIDVAMGKTMRQFDRAKYGVPNKSLATRYLAFLPGGKQLLLRDEREAVVHLLDAQSGDELRAFRCEGNPLGSFASSADGRLLAVGESTGSVRLWEIPTGKERFTVKKRPVFHSALTFSPDGKILAAGDVEGVAHLWDVATGTIVHTLDARVDQGPGPHAGIGSLSFAPDGKTLLASHRFWLVFWDAATGKEIRRLRNDHSLALRYLADGKTLVAGGDLGWYRGDNRFHFIDIETGKPCRQFDGHSSAVQALAYSPDGKYIATADEGGFDEDNPPELRVWEVRSGRVVFQSATKGTMHLTALAFSPKGDLLAAASWNNITLWDLKTGKPRRTLQNHQAAPSGSLAFSRDGTRLACAGQDDSIRVWDLDGDRELVNLHVGVQDTHALYTRDVSFSPDLHLAACGDWNARSVPLWDLANGKELKKIRRGGRGLVNVAFSPDGRTLLEASEGGRKLSLWEVATGQLRRALALSSFPHWDMACSPDGRRMAVAQDSSDAQRPEPCIWLFDLASNRPPAKLAGYQGSALALAFSPDSRFLASGSSDTTALLWDIAGLDPGTPVAPLTRDQRAACWRDLAGNGEQAYSALWKLVNDAGSLELFREKLTPAPAPADPKRVSELLADLDSPQFAARSSAQEQLARFGAAAETQLRNVLSGKTTLEVRQRVEKLLAAIESERLRTRRAIEAVELINTAPARELLQTLATGAAEAWLTLEAKASLARLSPR